MTTPPDPAEPDPADADPDVDDDAVTVDPSITSALASGYAALSGADLGAVRNIMSGLPLGELNRMQGILDGHRASLDAARNAMSALPLGELDRLHGITGPWAASAQAAARAAAAIPFGPDGQPSAWAGIAADTFKLAGLDSPNIAGLTPPNFASLIGEPYTVPDDYLLSVSLPPPDPTPDLLRGLIEQSANQAVEAAKHREHDARRNHLSLIATWVSVGIGVIALVVSVLIARGTIGPPATTPSAPITVSPTG